MNISNKLTVSRIILSIVIIVLLVFPFDTLNLSLPKLFINEMVVVDMKYLIAGILFIIAAITDYFDGYFARKRNEITDYGKVMDSIADKILVDSVLILLSSYGFVHPIIPVTIVLRDIIVDSIKMIVGNKGVVVSSIKMGKIKAFLLMIGIALTLFYNLPFELWNFRVSDAILMVATILSVVSGIEYYNLYKKYLTF